MIQQAVRTFVIAAMAVVALSATAGARGIEWHECPEANGLDPRQECASLPVPLDYATPRRTTIDIAVSRIPAESPTARRGVLVFNPGGPGQPGIYGPTQMAQTLPPSVRERYDLVGFDPRGVNFSAPVGCGLAPEDQDVIRFVPYPSPTGDISENVAYSRRAAEGCAVTSGGLLPHITTANAARDMDRIRVALGEQRISYFGYSYGTYLGAVYATLFPQRADRFLLDSNVHPGRIWRSTFYAWGPAAEAGFPSFARYAADHDETYGLGATPTAVREKLFELLAEVEKEPYVLPGDFVIDDRWFRELVRTALRTESSFPELATIWQLIDQREGVSVARATAAYRHLRADALPARVTTTPAAAASAGYPVPPVDNAFASPWAVVCGDADWPESPATYQRDVTLASQLFPIVGPAAANIWPCAFWPFEPRDAPVAIGSMGGGSALLVQSALDPATPYDGGVALRARLGARSRMVSVGNGGHAIAFSGRNACADDAAARFLADGELPSKDVACPAEPVPTSAGARSGPR